MPRPTAKKRSTPPSAWQVHLSKYRAAHPSKPLKQCMIEASKSYRKTASTPYRSTSNIKKSEYISLKREYYEYAQNGASAQYGSYPKSWKFGGYPTINLTYGTEFFNQMKTSIKTRLDKEKIELKLETFDEVKKNQNFI